ncbi:hypothetical protein M8834_34985, partial [Pseudomonas aeruginosa]|uniref:hypothetical protein n=1 Tax=Pseudomonas aeruginosa TaxID=287 RepID=UPI0020216AB5
FGHASSSKIPELQGCGGFSSRRRAGLFYRRRRGSLGLDFCGAGGVTGSGEQLFALFSRSLAARVVDPLLIHLFGPPRRRRKSDAGFFLNKKDWDEKQV